MNKSYSQYNSHVYNCDNIFLLICKKNRISATYIYMIKKLFIFGILICLTNCSAPGSALFGPTFTGVKTGSVYQTSVSYGSGKVMKTIREKVLSDINSNPNTSSLN